MYYSDESKINIKETKMYHIETASKIICLLAQRKLFTNYVSYYENTILEKIYLDYFTESLKLSLDENYSYVSFIDISKAIHNYVGKSLDFNNLNKDTSFNKKQIFLIAFFLLLSGHPKNIDEKHYKFKIEKTEKCWKNYVKHFKKIVKPNLDKEMFSFDHAMYQIMLCILPHERDLYFTQDFIADTSASLAYYQGDIADFDFDKEIAPSDSTRTTVKNNIHTFLEKIGHSIKNFKKNKNYRFPIDVTVILIAYFSFNDGLVYRNIMNDKVNTILNNEKNELVLYTTKLMGRFFRYYFCYNDNIHCFPYKPITHKICDPSCNSLDKDACLHYKVYTSYWRANIAFDQKVNSLENEIFEDISKQLKEITSTLRNEDPYFGFLRLTPDKLMDYPEHDTEVDLHKAKVDKYSNLTYYERLYYLNKLESSLRQTIDAWSKEMEEFQNYKEYRYDIDYVNFFDSQFAENNQYIDGFQQNPNDKLNISIDELRKIFKAYQNRNHCD
ncbi:hypothetical protein V6615_11840 [Oscillospiraceae bacterium PP1C4]